MSVNLLAASTLRPVRGTARWLEALRTQPKAWWHAEILGIVLVIGFADWVLPWEFNLFIFYLAPIFLAAWYLDRRSAIYFAVLVDVVWAVANYRLQPYSLQAYAWMGFNRLVSLVIVAFGASAMRAERESINAKVFALERTRELEEEIVRVAEREQMRIGQDLHDGLCQQLAAIDCAIACLKEDLTANSPEDVKTAALIQGQLNGAIREARDLARGIFPVQVDEEGLPAALEELAANTNRLLGVSVDLRLNSGARIKDPQAAMHLYRIVQEALNNATKHGKAEHVTITMTPRNNKLELTIADDGAGVRVAPSGAKGMGMHTMRYRANLLGGN